MKRNGTNRLLLVFTLIFIQTTAFAQVNERFRNTENEYERKGSMLSDIQNMKRNFQFNGIKAKALFSNPLEQVDIYTPDEFGSLQKSFIENFSYSEDGLVVIKTSQAFNTDTQQWEEDATFILTIREDGRPESFNGVYKFGTSTRTFTYNGEGQLTSNKLVDNFNYGNGNVINAIEEYTFTPHTDDSASYTYNSEFNGEKQTWDGYFVQKGEDLQEVFSQTVPTVGLVTDRIIEYGTTLDQSMNMFYDPFYNTERYHDYNLDGGGWIPYTREVHTITEGKLMSRVFSFYDTDNQSWVESTKSDFEYDSEGRLAVENDWFFWESWERTQTLRFTYALSTSSKSEENVKAFELSQNYPNPFNPSTTINYSISSSQEVSLNVFNVLGKKVAELVSGVQSSGDHSITFNASNLPSGIYYYTLITNDFTETKAMTLIK